MPPEGWLILNFVNRPEVRTLEYWISKADGTGQSRSVRKLSADYMLGKSTHRIISRSAFLLSGVALVAMTGSTFVSLFGTDTLRNFVDCLSHTGPVTALDRISDVPLANSSRVLAIMAAGTTVLLWALRRRLIDLLARSSTAPPEVDYAWITSVELVVVSGVIATKVVLAVQNLSLPMRGDEALT